MYLKIWLPRLSSQGTYVWTSDGRSYIPTAFSNSEKPSIAPLKI